MKFAPQPTVLSGEVVRLVPLAREHASALWEAGADPRIWTFLPRPAFRNRVDAEAWIEESLRAQACGAEVPFVTIRQSDGQVVGSTRYLDIRRPHRALEIGWTWLTPTAQRTKINTEAKFLMLHHAFENLGVLRVQLKTDARNAQSRAAILRIGATFEGILRKHMVRAYDGYQRDSAIFSVIDSDWPAVKAALLEKLARGA